MEAAAEMMAPQTEGAAVPPRTNDWTDLLGQWPPQAPREWARTVDPAGFEGPDALLRRLEAIVATERDGYADGLMDAYDVRWVQILRIPEYLAFRFGFLVVVFGGLLLPFLIYLFIGGGSIPENAEGVPYAQAALLWALGMAMLQWAMSLRRLSLTAVVLGLASIVTAAAPILVPFLGDAPQMVPGAVPLSFALAIAGSAALMLQVLGSPPIGPWTAREGRGASGGGQNWRVLRIEQLERILVHRWLVGQALPLSFTGDAGGGLHIIRDEAIGILRDRGLLDEASAERARRSLLGGAGQPHRPGR